jgi:outer membrane protein OmpA-like peptidoglycan-associated protein
LGRRLARFAAGSIEYRALNARVSARAARIAAMRTFLAPIGLSLACLAACTSTAPEQTGPLPAPTPDQRAAVPAQLAVEHQWLNAWFKGTPVRIRQVDDSAITIDVPREFCFDPGKSAIKPALGAVLEKTTQSLQRLPLANVVLIAAPADAQGSTALALQRAGQIHDRLRNAGIRAERLGRPSVASAPAVQLRLEASPL